MRVFVYLLAVAVLLGAFACSGGGDAGESVDDAAPLAATDATVTGTPQPEPSATPAATLDGQLGVVYIANTDGDGVSLRTACQEDARLADAWPEGTAVRIIEPGAEDCAAWTYVIGPRQASWVRNAYLSAAGPSGPPAHAASDKAPGQKKQKAAREPMFVFGDSSPGTLVTVFAGGELCDSARADANAGLWALEVGGATLCDPTAGDFLTFSVEGDPVQTAGFHIYEPGGTQLVTLITP